MQPQRSLRNNLAPLFGFRPVTVYRDLAQEGGRGGHWLESRVSCGHGTDTLTYELTGRSK